ncbi:uncharacterized protein LOC144877147 [Branchiostoma floridae x Branchiostoma japonicum]
MTNSQCLEHCRQQGFSYAGTQYSTQCFCGTERNFADLGEARPAAECGRSCGGDAAQVCGGSWRLSVYRVTDCTLWTRWFDRDDPSGTADSELLSDLRQENPGEICSGPAAVQARVRATHVAANQTGQQFESYGKAVGFLCRNTDQSDGTCLDYEVRFCCDSEPVGLWTFNAENGMTDITGNGNDAVTSTIELSEGPNGTSGSYEFSGSSSSYVEIPNNGRLDVRYSLTVLASIYPTGDHGPLFNYRTDDWGFHFWQTAANQIFVRAVTRGGTLLEPLPETARFLVPAVTRDGTLLDAVSADVLVQSAWNYVGATYNYGTGELAVWHEGSQANSQSVGVTELATQYAVRVGFRDGESRAFSGRIACLQLYDYAMQQGQILEARTKCDGKAKALSTKLHLFWEVRSWYYRHL